jgi:hypothetical protein
MVVRFSKAHSSVAALSVALSCVVASVAVVSVAVSSVEEQADNKRPATAKDATPARRIDFLCIYVQSHQNC